MKVCACTNAGTSKCIRCLYSSLHLGDVPGLPKMEPSLEIIQLKDELLHRYIEGYIKGAADYGGIIVCREDVRVPD